jgi:MEMO1 family protein
MIRQPAVAHRFYPGDPGVLRQTIADLLPAESPEKRTRTAVIVPHAGYIYSGGVAAETFARVAIPPDILLLGPNHHGSGARIALMRHGYWQTPLGRVALNEKLADCLIAQDPNLIKEDDTAHRLEHSLEVQVPFLQHLRGGLTLTPLALSHLSFSQCAKLGTAVAAAIKEYDQPVLMVASTDMTHYETRTVAAAQDHLAIERILELDPEGLYQVVATHGISMCGVIPTTVALVAAVALGAHRAELVRYTDSGEISGEIAQVVGYAGLVID